MSVEPNVALRPTLRDLSAWFAAPKTQYLLIGGAAASLLGRPRTTRDVDAVVLIEQDDPSQFVASGAAFNFLPRVSDLIAFAQKSRVLLMAHQPEQTGVDISMAGLAFEMDAIAHGTLLRADDIELRLPRVDDLIVMKAVASRPADLADIDTLVKMHRSVDRRRIRRLVAEFADVLQTPEIVERLESVLRPRGSRARTAKRSRRKQT